MMKKLFLLFILFVNLQICFVGKTLCVQVQGVCAQNQEREHGELNIFVRDCPIDGEKFYSEKDWNEHVQDAHPMMHCPDCGSNYRKGIDHKCDGKKKDQDDEKQKDDDKKKEDQQQKNGRTGQTNIGGINFGGISVPNVPQPEGKKTGGGGYVQAGVVITVTVPGWEQDTSGRNGTTQRNDDIIIENKDSISYDWDWGDEEEAEIKINENKKAPCPDDPDDFDTTTQPGAFEGAVMSELSYGNEETRDKCKKKLVKEYDWEVADEEAKKMDIKLHDSDTGLDCTLLKKPDGSGFVLAFAGTDPEQTNVTKATVLETLMSGLSLNFIQQILAGFPGFSMLPDVKTDLYQWFYGMEPQYFQAMATAKKLTRELKKKYGDNVKITFVGHSLGGGLASLASIVTGYPALTYNAAALSPMSKLELKMMGYNIDSSNINRYSMETDPLTGLQCKCSLLAKFADMFDYNALGENHEVMYDDDVSWFDKTNVIPFKNWKKNHSCVTIIDNLDCDEVEWSNKE